jgi:hypothetical protein
LLALLIGTFVQVDQVHIVDDEKLPDGMTTRWDADVVRTHVQAAVQRWQPSWVRTCASNI